MRLLSGLRGVLGLLGMLAAGLVTAPDEARAVCSVLSPHPCTPGFGSVLSHHPYTPGFCGVYSGPNCTPEIVYPLNQVPVLKVEGHVGPTEPLDRDHPADRIDELGPLLSKCLELPPDDEARDGMRVTLRLAFKRDGELIAAPRFTYTTHEATRDVKAAYRQAALDMLKRCAPLPITDGLGAAIAGRPFVVAIIDRRNDQKDEARTRPEEKHEPPTSGGAGGGGGAGGNSGGRR
jgi:hypothetical protein